jgi:hypothetical protein
LAINRKEPAEPAQEGYLPVVRLCPVDPPAFRVDEIRLVGRSGGVRKELRGSSELPLKPRMLQSPIALRMHMPGEHREH